ncbi:protein kinase [Histoplasma ohiense]|nr:protein kinase [Histoplasma ohiense (nom. inval.)]
MSNKEPPIPLVLTTSTTPNALRLSAPSPLSALTPPLTPTTPTNTPASSGDQNPPEHQISVQRASDDGKLEGDQTELRKQQHLPLEFAYDLELQRDPGGSLIEYGCGAWSVVYSATSRWIRAPRDSPPTPPQRRVSTFTSASNLAVKSPMRCDANSILLAEARLLSRLSTIPGVEHHVVPFHGFISSSNSLVLSALPLSLSAYISNQAASARQTFSTKTMFNPVLGMSQWLSLARKLVRGLEWLHSRAQIVHGDIKPQNILLRPRESSHSDCAKDHLFPYEPFYIDFTSSYDPSTTGLSPQGPSPSLSALSPPFAAPELLTVQSLKSTEVVQSKGSDVFSLAVTLLAAVTGDLLLHPGSSNMQRLAMSREGHRVLDHVRSGVHGSRLPIGGIVEKILSPAVVKDPETRIKPADWLRMIEDVIAAEDSHK